MKRSLLTILTILSAALSFAQNAIVSWDYELEQKEDNIVNVIFTGTIAPEYHTYTLDDEISPTEIFDAVLEGAEESAQIFGSSDTRLIDGHQAYEGVIQLVQPLRLTSDKGNYSGTIFTVSCKHGQCRSEYYDFNIPLNAPENAAASVIRAGGYDDSGSIWSLILEAILW